ncbi:MAG: hypothetical protein AYK19_19905 [Theionarchaea archaeon DG-70-1]|nr:MAG: hypothetical protein AYK19_19905 [Theionarchaea archaeon DG-70-1]
MDRMRKNLKESRAFVNCREISAKNSNVQLISFEPFFDQRNFVLITCKRQNSFLKSKKRCNSCLWQST